MINYNFTKNLISIKNEVLNYFSSQSQLFYFNFLNDKVSVGNYKIGSREQNFGAHLRVQNYEVANNGFKRFETQKLYYITFNTLGLLKNNEETLSFSLRLDLLKYWAQCNTQDLYVLVADKQTKTFYEYKVSTLISKYIAFIKNQKDNYFDGVAVINEKTPYTCVTFEIVDKDLEKEVKFNSNEYIQNCPLAFDAQFYMPQYIGNFTYATYRAKTPVVLHFYDVDGKYRHSKTYRSIKEVYDALSKRGYDKTYKTLQRAAADEALIELDCGKFYISKDIEAPAINLTIEEIVLEETDNPFYDGTDETIPAKMPVKTERKITKEKKPLTVENIEEVLEENYHYDETDDREDGMKQTFGENAQRATNIYELLKDDEEYQQMKNDLLDAFRIKRDVPVGKALF